MVAHPDLSENPVEDASPPTHFELLYIHNVHYDSIMSATGDLCTDFPTLSREQIYVDLSWYFVFSLIPRSRGRGVCSRAAEVHRRYQLWMMIQIYLGRPSFRRRPLYQRVLNAFFTSRNARNAFCLWLRTCQIASCNIKAVCIQLILGLKGMDLSCRRWQSV